jgi:hypothetical protein
MERTKANRGGGQGAEERALAASLHDSESKTKAKGRGPKTVRNQGKKTAVPFSLQSYRPTGELSGADAPISINCRESFHRVERAGPTTTAATQQAGHHYGKDRERPR